VTDALAQLTAEQIERMLKRYYLTFNTSSMANLEFRKVITNVTLNVT